MLIYYSLMFRNTLKASVDRAVTTVCKKQLRGTTIIHPACALRLPNEKYRLPCILHPHYMEMHLLFAATLDTHHVEGRNMTHKLM